MRLHTGGMQQGNSTWRKRARNLPNPQALDLLCTLQGVRVDRAAGVHGRGKILPKMCSLVRAREVRASSLRA